MTERGFYDGPKDKAFQNLSLDPGTQRRLSKNLLYYIKEGDAAIVREIIESGANVNYQDPVTGATRAALCGGL